MSAEFRAAFLDFQQHGSREENSLLRYAARQAYVDHHVKLGPDIKGQPYGVVKHDKILDYIVDCWRKKLLVITRLPYDRGHLFVKVE